MLDCKCSHSSDEHRFNRFTRDHYECDKCPCEEYVQNKGTSWTDKIQVILGLSFITIFLFTGGLIFYIANIGNWAEASYDLMSNFDGNPETGVMVFVGLVIFFGTIHMYSTLVSPWLKHKRRRTFDSKDK